MEGEKGGKKRIREKERKREAEKGRTCENACLLLGYHEQTKHRGSGGGVADSTFLTVSSLETFSPSFFGFDGLCDVAHCAVKVWIF